MRLVTALVKPFKVEDVKEAVLKAGGAGLTITESRGFGRQRGHSEVYRGTEYRIEFVPKVRVEVLVEELHADDVANAIADAARTGNDRRRKGVDLAGRDDHPRADRRARPRGVVTLTRF